MTVPFLGLVSGWAVAVEMRDGQRRECFHQRRDDLGIDEKIFGIAARSLGRDGDDAVIGAQQGGELVAGVGRRELDVGPADAQHIRLIGGEPFQQRLADEAVGADDDDACGRGRLAELMDEHYCVSCCAPARPRVR